MNARCAEWKVSLTGDGSPTLVHPQHREACHSQEGAWTEALERYARPCGLFDWSEPRPLRLADIGTGLGLNLAAALEALAFRGASEGGQQRPMLHVDAFERERAPLEWAVRSGGEIPGPWSGSHAVVRRALALALVTPGACVPLVSHAGAELGWLRLHLGGAEECVLALPQEARFDAVFLDPFSPPNEPSLWSVPFLSELAQRLAPHGRLSTYSAASSVRIGLAAAGLAVGRGPRVGHKREGTLAVPAGEAPPTPLEPRVARRVARRSAEYLARQQEPTG